MSSNKYKDKHILDLLAILRSEDATQYMFLIKMHLSFLTDFQTDQCDGSFDSGNSINSDKWYLSPIMKKLLRGNSNQNSGNISLTHKVLHQVFYLMQYLKRDENISQEGLFRKTGSVARQSELKSALLNGESLNLESGNYSAHDCASVLKIFLSNLPEPILQEKEYHVHCRIAEMCRKNMTKEEQKNAYGRQVKALSLIFLLLPTMNYELLRELLMLLYEVILHEKNNKMSSSNLGTLFAPHILCPRKMSANDLQCQSGSLSSTVAFIIENTPQLFQIPYELAVDVREYFRTRELEGKHLKNPLEVEPTKTSLSFIHQELTAKANEKDVTKIALAQLYAFVQSMPESTKKKKLVCKFNEVSGLGTPKYSQNLQKGYFKPKNFKYSWKKHLKMRNPRNSFKKALNIRRLSSEDNLSISNIYSPDSQAEKSSIIKTASPKSCCNNAQNFDHSNILAFNCQNDVYGDSPQFSSSALLTSTPVNVKKVVDEVGNENLDPRLRSNDCEIEQFSNLVSNSLVPPIHKSNMRFLDSGLNTGSNIQNDHNFFDTSKYECDNSSPISLALKNFTNHQKLVMTPRSRQPIVINSSSSLPSLTMQEKACLLQVEEGLEDVVSPPIVSKEGHSKKDESVLDISEKNSTFGSVFKCLSTASLINLVTKLEYSTSSDGNGTSTLINCSNCNDTLQNDTLTSVFKEYLLGRSIIYTDSLVNTPDSIPTEPDDNSSKNLCLDDSLENVPKDFSYQSPLSQSLLFCLDGNHPSQFHSTPKKLIFSSNEAKCHSSQKYSESSSPQQKNSVSENVVMIESLGLDESVSISIQDQDSNFNSK